MRNEHLGQRPTGKQILRCAILGLLTALAFFMNMTDVTLELTGYGWFSRVFYNLYQRGYHAISGCETQISLAWVGFFLFYLYLECRKKDEERLKGNWLFSGFFGAMYVAGLVYLDEVPASSSGLQSLKLVMVWAGVTVFYHGLIQLFRSALSRDIHLQPGRRLDTLWRRFLRHPFRNTVLLLLLCWVIPLVLKYPAGLCYDVRFQIDQGLGNEALTSHHPILHTLLMTGFVRFGQLIGSANVGIFLFVVVEAVVFALAAGYGMCVLLRIHTANWSQFAYLLFFCFSPFVTGYVGAAIKDVYFSVFSLLFTIVFAESVLTEDFWASRKKILLFIGATTGLVLFRNNGIYVLLGTVLISVLVDHKKKKWRKRRFVVLLVACLVPICASKTLDAVYNPEDGSIVEALSLPLQQTARMVKYHSDEITEEEREIIDKVLDYDSLAEVYDPYLSDAVKQTYQNPTTEELLDYLVVWAKQFFREPGCYLAATLQQNVMLVYPGYTNYTYYIGSYDDGYPNAYGILFTTPAFLASLQTVYSGLIDAMHHFPILYWVNNMAVFVILLFVLAFFFLNRRDYKNLLYLVPAFIALAVVVCAPGVILNVRYVLPIIYVIPFYLGCYTSPFSASSRTQLSTA